MTEARVREQPAQSRYVLMKQLEVELATFRRRNRSLLTHSLTAALDQLRVVASSTSNDPGPQSRQHQQIGQRLLPLAAANFSRSLQCPEYRPRRHTGHFVT